MTWILILFVHAGSLSSTDSMAITNIPEFKTQAACVAAGAQADNLVRRTSKDVRFICVKAE